MGPTRRLFLVVACQEQKGSTSDTFRRSTIAARRPNSYYFLAFFLATFFLAAFLAAFFLATADTSVQKEPE